ncbi:MAG: type VI secretion system tip protein VgrG [Alphaproteobacteria bacterium]|nr:type VI secretion system tip protein VgrG [Alphaproteobacteria bacterium]
MLDALDSKPTNLTTFTVKAGGQALGAEYEIASIEVRREVNRVPKATLVLVDGDASAQTFATSEEETLVPGTEIEILGGYSSEETTLFKGVITRHRIEVGRRGGSFLTVEARDPVFRMTIGRRSRNFSDVTDSDVIEQIIGLNQGLTADVTATSVTHPQIVQHQVSDWDFIVMRAEMAGHAVICVDGKVSVGPPAVAGAAEVTAAFGQGLFSADLELDAETQFTSVETGAWDMANQELVTTQADDAATPGPGNIPGSDLANAGGVGEALRHDGALDQSMLDQWAAAAMGRARRSAVRGKVRVQGNAALVPGVLVELGGLGARFNGLGLVSGVRHRLGAGDWESEVIIGSDPKPHAERYQVAAPGASGTIPPVRGLQIGVVAALESDPAGEDRIQIRLPSITETDGLVWARQALLDAGDSRSTSFKPEVGDEVVVGFLNDDPRYPVVLGALHSSAKPNPIPGTNDNHEKAIVTRSGMRLHWNDDKVVATIDTPAGNRIVLSEDDTSILVEDQNGNKLELNADGIAMESAKDIKLKATGDVKIEGVNVEVKASASFKAEGSGGAELKSSASTVVKGSLVQIN